MHARGRYPAKARKRQRECVDLCSRRSLFSFRFNWKAHATASLSLYRRHSLVGRSLSFTKRITHKYYALLCGLSIHRDFFHKHSSRIFQSTNLHTHIHRHRNARVCISRTDAEHYFVVKVFNRKQNSFSCCLDVL